MRPGSTVERERSTISYPAGMASPGPTAVIRSPSMRMTASRTGGESEPSISRPARTATWRGGSAARAEVDRARARTEAIQKARGIPVSCHGIRAKRSALGGSLQLGAQTGKLGFGGLPGLGLAVSALGLTDGALGLPSGALLSGLLSLLGSLPGSRKLTLIQQPLAGPGVGHLKASVFGDTEQEAGGLREQAT